jgi:hypothetical protein
MRCLSGNYLRRNPFMSRRKAYKHRLEALFVNPTRIVETVQKEDENFIPFRQLKVLFPIYNIEASGEQEEEVEYELLEHYIELGIQECGLTTATQLNKFFGLDDIQIIDKMLAFLRAIDHVCGSDDQLELTDLGKKSLEMASSCRILKTKRTFYFDTFQLKPLPKVYYDLHFLSREEANALRDPTIYRLHGDDAKRGWDESVMYALAEQDDRADYNLPRGITIHEVENQGVVYLPMSIVEMKQKDAKEDDMSSYLVITPIRGFRDNYFTELINGDLATQEALQGTFGQRKSVNETLKDWLRGRPFSRQAELVEKEKNAWQLHLEREVFKNPTLYYVNLRDIGSYKLASNYYFVQYWSDDLQVRYDAAMEQLISTLDWQQRQKTLRPALVERIFERVSNRLQIETINWPAFRSYAKAHQKEDLLDILEESLQGLPFLERRSKRVKEEKQQPTNGLVTEVQVYKAKANEESTSQSRPAHVKGTSEINGPWRLLDTISHQAASLALQQKKDIQSTWLAYGNLKTDARRYQPLDTVTVFIQGRVQGDHSAQLRVCDSQQRAYFETTVELFENRGRVQFLAGGTLGVHYIYLIWPGEEHHSRCINVLLTCETTIKSGDPDFDVIYPLSHELMLLARREHQLPVGKLVGYISANPRHFDAIQIQDWLSTLCAYKYWEQDIIGSFTSILNMRDDNGLLPTGIQRTGEPWRNPEDRDIECVFTAAAWQTWLVTGDTIWLQQVLPELESLLQSLLHDPQRWDTDHQMMKRQQGYGSGIRIQDDGGEQEIITLHDQAGYYLACCTMNKMYAVVHDDARSTFWLTQAEDCKKRTEEYLWDGKKFLQYIPLAASLHDNSKVEESLSMYNTWAITRELADRTKAQSIINEYYQRQIETGAAYPWWNQQIGYPNNTKATMQSSYLQSSDINDSLIPWVGGELCLGAFQSERAYYAVELLRQYSDHLQRTGNLHAWYWFDGEAGSSTPNDVPYASWGLAQWVAALIEGLAGLQDQTGRWQQVMLTPRWALVGAQDIYVSAKYGCNDSYFAYHMNIDPESACIVVDYSGSGRHVIFHILIPEGWEPGEVHLNNETLAFERWKTDDGLYLVFSCTIDSVSQIIVQC